MISTINISLPKQLKKKCDELVKKGYYVSFSDMVRTSIRGLLENQKNERMWRKAKLDHLKGRTKVLENIQDIDNYFDEISQSAKNSNDAKIRQGIKKVRKSSSNI